MVQDQPKRIIIPEVIIGLGNPESQYDKTRHNIGFEIVDDFANKWGFTWQKNNKFNALLAEGFAPNRQKIKLVKPLTYMNRSGQTIRAVLDWYKLSQDSILVIYDDMDLPLGKIRLRLSGSAGGHNGIKSIISHLNTQNFPRFRIGIGKSGSKERTISHVLGKFSATETQILHELKNLVEEAIILSLNEGIEKAMSLYNQQSISIPDINNQ